VNGGGAVTLQFQRSPFRPQTKTVFVPWNQIVVLPPVQMVLNDDEDLPRPMFKCVFFVLFSDILVASTVFFSHKIFFSVTPPNPAYSFLHTSQYRFVEDVKSAKTPLPAICLDHDHELLKPQLTSTWMPNGVGSMVGHSVVFAETQVRTLFNVVIRSKKEKKT
jgi:teneurin